MADNEPLKTCLCFADVGYFKSSLFSMLHISTSEHFFYCTLNSKYSWHFIDTVSHNQEPDPFQLSLCPHPTPSVTLHFGFLVSVSI